MSVASAELSARERFLSRVESVFDEEGLDYVVLHAYGSKSVVDSDIDVAVARKDVEFADALIRSGAFGRLYQRVDYDVPWCRWYVLESDEQGRRYRQLDIACDPWGIGRYGRALPLALSRATRSGSHRVARPAAETLYLAVKRATKGARGVDIAEQLARAFQRDPGGAAELLERCYGSSGRSVAAALERGNEDLSRELASLARAVARDRPIARRTLFSSGRIIRRIARPTGLAICLAGPDGVGKSTLAERLPTASHGLFRQAQRLHLRPGILPPPAHLLGRGPSDGSEPHARLPSGRIGSLARLGYLWLDTAVGWWPRVAGPRIRSTLIILERGWLDLAVDGKRYRLSLPAWLIGALGLALPHPDLTLVLDAPSDVVYGRKPELEMDEIERQRLIWRSHAKRHPARMVLLDASAPPDAVLDEALRRIDDHLARRQRDLTQGRLLVECMGGVSRTGQSYAVVARRGHMRWLLPAGLGHAGPKGTGLYRPARARHAAAAAALEAVHRGGGGLLRHIELDPARGLLPPIEEALGRKGLVLAGVVAGEERPARRAVLSVLEAGRPVAFAKIERGDSAGSEHERRVLSALAGCRLQHFSVSEILGFFSWRDFTVLLLAPLPQSGRADRSMGGAERAALSELGRLGHELSAVLGSREHEIPVHGDFAPWNCAPAQRKLALWDWEEARLGLPLEDVFHWLTQRLVLFGVGSVEEVVSRALDPDPELRVLCASLGATPDIAPAALQASLERDLGRGGSELAVSVRRRALRLLAEAQG